MEVLYDEPTGRLALVFELMAWSPSCEGVRSSVHTKQKTKLLDYEKRYSKLLICILSVFSFFKSFVTVFCLSLFSETIGFIGSVFLPQHSNHPRSHLNSMPARCLVTEDMNLYEAIKGRRHYLPENKAPALVDSAYLCRKVDVCRCCA